MDSSETAVHDIIETKPEDALSLVASDPGESVEVEPEDAAYEPKTHEDASAEEESHIDVNSHAEEEIESYDEDFPDESHHEAYDEYKEGDVEVEASNGVFEESSVVEEVERQHGVESEYTHDTNPHIPEEVYDHTEEVEEQHLFSRTSQDVSTDLHYLGGVALYDEVKGSTESKTNSTAVGTDLEDIVNLLESGANVHRPSFEASSGSSSVDAGEIPDEY